MTKVEILNYENQYVDEETFEEIELSEYVDSIKNGGSSGVNPYWTWYIVHFTDGDEIGI